LGTLSNDVVIRVRLFLPLAYCDAVLERDLKRRGLASKRRRSVG